MSARELHDAFIAGWQAAQEENIEDADDIDIAGEEKFIDWLFKTYPPQAY
jgi:hypothetical protein